MNCLGIITGADGHLAKNVINVLDNYCDKVFLTDITYDKETIQKNKYEKINLDVTDEQSVKSFFQSIEINNLFPLNFELLYEMKLFALLKLCLILAYHI